MAVLADRTVATTGCLRNCVVDEPQAFCDHLLRLSAADRYQRFGMCVTDEGIRTYVAEKKHGLGFVYAILTQDIVRGAIEARPTTDTSCQLEIGLTIERSWRGMGFGTELVRTALVHAQIAGFTSVVAFINLGNRDMISIAGKFGAQMAELGDCVAAEWRCSVLRNDGEHHTDLRRKPMPGDRTTVVAR